MTIWGLVRIKAFIITSLIVYFTHFFGWGDTGIYAFSAISGAILIPHYFMGFWASYPKFKNLMTFRKGQIAIFIWLLVSIVGFYYEPEYIIFFFGIHFAFSEAYSKSIIDNDKAFFTQANTYRRIFTALQINFLTAGYMCATHHSMLLVEKFWFAYPLLKTDRMVFYFAISAFAYFTYFLLYSSKVFGPKKSRKEIFISFAIPDILLAFGFAAGFYLALNYVVWVLYHIIQWIVLPIPRFKKQWNSMTPVVFKYLAPTVLMFAIYMYFHPLEYKTPILASEMGLKQIPLTHFHGGRQSRIPQQSQMLSPYIHYYGAPADAYQYKFYLEVVRWGWLHVLSAFIISSLNPMFIRRFLSKDGKI